jgi:hypothetical protein
MTGQHWWRQVTDALLIKTLALGALLVLTFVGIWLDVLAAGT